MSEDKEWEHYCRTIALVEASLISKPIEERCRQFDVLLHELSHNFPIKNTDYRDAFATYGTLGVLVRIGDKIRRYIQVADSGLTLVTREGLRDTLMDLASYAILATMLLDEETENVGRFSVKESIGADFDWEYIDFDE